MGNQPSSSNKSGSGSGTGTSGPSPASDSPRPTRRDNRHPIPVHNQRAPAPPAASLASAHGSTSTASSARPRSIAHPSSPPTNSASSSVAQVEARAGSGSSQQTTTTPIPFQPVPSNKDSPAGVPEHTKPMAVPSSHPGEPLSPYADSIDITPSMMRGSMQDMSYLTRPPRLPLPIDEEIHTPGSPIIGPSDGDLGPPIEELEQIGEEDDDLSRKASSGTVEDEEAELIIDKTRPTVPTYLEWPYGGKQVYVTGTIFSWSKKYRLFPVEGRPGCFAATVPIFPGTHHIRFLVDGQMQTTPDLPTTVDFGNNLVNYIEITAGDLPSTKQQSEEDPSSTMYAPKEPKKTEAEGEEKPEPKTKKIWPKEAYTNKIPQYLLDFDQPEDTREYQIAAAAIARMPGPPPLPAMLSKPILNATALIKDDNSVLNMPNHTTLNHLGTSSIKNATLAVSATTRYKNKYVTTIIYKPTETHDRPAEEQQQPNEATTDS